MKHAPIFALSLFLSPVAAQAADVVILGEVHDNPAHHMVQAGAVSANDPAALVFEMLTPAQAETVTPDLLNDENALRAALDWDNSGWPDFAIYYPIFAAAGALANPPRIYGAQVPRSDARAAMQAGLVEAFGADSVAYGLSAPLDSDQQSAREALQMTAHCDALPAELLPAMVDVQRLRDATLARATLAALDETATDETGGRVLVITGNGHARKDWGVPAYLARLRPALSVLSLGQSEGGAIDGGFDLILPAAPVDRPDPCEAFRKG